MLFSLVSATEVRGVERPLVRDDPELSPKLEEDLAGMTFSSVLKRSLARTIFGFYEKG